MKFIRIALTSLVVVTAMMLSSCDSPTGTGAALGAGTGVLIGHAIGRADDRGYYDGKQLLYGRSLGGGMVESPCRPYNTIDTRGIPHGAVVEDPTTGGRFIKP